MSEGSLQSRKICFVDVEAETMDFFGDALPDHDVIFAEYLSDVPEDAEIASVFINERLDAAFLDAHPALKLVCTRSTGCDHIDIEACRARNITVTNVGHYGENTVAEHTFALMLALTRRLADSQEAIRTGRFSRARLQGIDLRGRTLGIIGAGRVGLHVARLARAFGMKVLAFDSQPQPFYAGLLEFCYVSFEELLRESHVITLHVPLNPATYHLFNRETLALCRPGVIIINTARGGLMDAKAVIAGLDSGQIGGLGLDVLEDERLFQGGATSVLGAKIVERVRSVSLQPQVKETSASRLSEFSRLVMQNELLHRPNVVLTPHVAFNSAEAVASLRRETLENILAFIRGDSVKHRCT